MSQGRPPPGIESRGHAIWLVCVIMPFITAIFLGLRVYTKTRILGGLALNDYVAIVTMAFIIAYSVTLAQATYTGMGYHISDITPQLNAGYYFWVMVASEFYVLSLAGYKTALILLYLALFGVNRKFRYTCYAVLCYTLGYLFCNLVTEVAGCRPIQAFYNKQISGECINYNAADIAYGVGHMSSDLFIAILPMPMIYRLNLKTRREKFGLAFVLSAGFVAWAFALVRFAYACVDLTSEDRTWIAGMTFLLSVLEVNTGLICGCTPALKPFLKVARQRVRESSLSKASIWSLSKPRYSSGDGSMKEALQAVEAVKKLEKGHTVSTSHVTDATPATNVASYV